MRTVWASGQQPLGRAAVLDGLAADISGVKPGHPTRVAIDGVDGAGKTTLADELVAPIARSGRQIIRASIDGFHRPRAERLSRGDTPEGYYLDSFNYPALKDVLLGPLGSGGSRRISTSVFNYRTDSESVSPFLTAAPDAILLFDGVFLLRPELNDYWDFRIFLQVGFEETLRRVTTRDAELFGSPSAVVARYQQRYVPGQMLYLDSVRPQSLADVVVDNTDPDHPALVGTASRHREPKPHCLGN